MTDTFSTIGIEAPIDFPMKPYESIHLAVTAKRNTHVAAWQHFAGGENGLAYRFTACAEYDATFVASVNRAGTSPVPSERHEQEKSLFGFFVNGLAALESFGYSLFAIGSMIKPVEFPLANPRMITIAETIQKFVKGFPSEGISAAMNTLNGDADYVIWKELRNIMAHRAAPPRRFHLGGTTDGLTILEQGIEINNTTTSIRRAWLAATVERLLTETESLVMRHLYL
jgi:hypothetical protein